MRTTRHRQFRETWEIFFYVANSSRSVTANECWQFVEQRIGLKTVQRALTLFVTLGFCRSWKDAKSTRRRFQYIGPLKPFTLHTRLWCSGCREFHERTEFKIVKGAFHRTCKFYANLASKRNYWRNLEFNKARQRRLYARKVVSRGV